MQMKEEFNSFKLSPNDVGSPGIVICCLTEQIQKLTEHMKINKKDKSSLRGLKKKVVLRKKMMSQYQKSNPSKFAELKQLLNLR